MSIEQLEAKLDSFNSEERKEALVELCAKVEAGQVELPQPGTDVNMHCHSFFSYNSYGYSPSKFAWLARKRGLAVAAIVDFDVLDGLDEFLQAARMVGLKACVSMETRVFVPEFSERVINSPGEPGISYHMGIGFTDAKFEGQQQEFLSSLRETAQQRNKELMGRVNEYLKPVVLSYENDVLPLTPANNPTERHVCLGYARKAKELFGDEGQLREFWVEKLGPEVRNFELPESREFLNALRAKTMKQAGVGYVRPEPKSFPEMADMNKFCLAAGAVPTYTWLNGLSDGEKEIERLLEVGMSTGVAAINIIPDRNYTPGVDDEKLRKLYDVVELAEGLGLPVSAGTEMNSPGQKFVDSFETAELEPLVPVFLKGAYILYAHSVLQRTCGLGYLSDWAKQKFETVPAKNEFFEEVGRRLEPSEEETLAGFSGEVGPEAILEML